jgi:hypothetical protein
MADEFGKHRPLNHARRHFLGLAAATGAKLAAISALAIAGLSAAAGAGHGNGKASANKGRGNRFGWWLGRGNPHRGGDPHCFLRGTAILTTTGNVPVEKLAVGDLVETVRGQALPVKWIGHRRFRRSNSSWSGRVMPIRVSRHAIDDHTPHADLYLSPSHALFLDGVLMPVRVLVNGRSIAPALPEDTEVIEYFHVILDSHEVILAEGAPAESCFLEPGDHEDFTNFVEFERLYGRLAYPPMTPFAPLVGTGSAREHLNGLLRLGLPPFADLHDPVLDARERIAARAMRVYVAD